MSESSLASGNSISSILADARKQARPTLSFEFYPFRDEASSHELWNTFDAVLEAGADFASLTYGAGGSSREKSFAVLERLAPQIATIGHLTAVGASAVGTASTIHRFEDLGVASILALRGDPPKNDPAALERGELTTALELLEVTAKESNLESGVAAFPEKHPESPTLAHDCQLLRKKELAGAKYAITQLFFSVAAYQELLDTARLQGVELEIIPGIMPISSANQVQRMVEMSGASVPTELLNRLDGASEFEARIIGMDFSIELASQLLEVNAPGLHLFTLNRHKGALQIAEEVGLVR